MNFPKIRTKAARHGTFVAPSTGQILYVDPDHEDAAYHSPVMTREDAAEAFKRGMIEDPADASDLKDDDGVPTDPNAIEHVGAERTEQFAKNDDEGGTGSGTLDSRSSTAWPDRGRVEGGAEGSTSGLEDGVDTASGDDDAPPAGKTRSTRKPAVE